MSTEQLAYLLRHTFLTALELAAPFLLVALLIGLLISFIQSATQLQEMTLSFVPKMVVIGAMLALLFPWMLKIITKFTHLVIVCQWDKVTSSLHYVQ